jgi:hypothetical protein
MAYVFQPRVKMPISLPPRPWQRRGMGQSTSCGWFANWICSGGKVDSVFGTACNSCPAGAAILPPGSPSSGSTVAGGLPAGYDPSTGLITPPATYTAGDLPTLSPPAPYEVSYPSNPGTNPAAPGQGGSVYTNCDWTAADWTDPTTWCGLNWAVAGVGLLGLVAFLYGMGGRR